jgi:hypothetical protein
MLLKIIFWLVQRVDWYIAAFRKIVMSSSLESSNTIRLEERATFCYGDSRLRPFHLFAQGVLKIQTWSRQIFELTQAEILFIYWWRLCIILNFIYLFIGGDNASYRILFIYWWRYASYRILFIYWWRYCIIPNFIYLLVAICIILNPPMKQHCNLLVQQIPSFERKNVRLWQQNSLYVFLCA